MTEFKDIERQDLHSGSSFDRTVNCHGWRNLYLQIPNVEYKPTTTPEAERGIRIHKARETMNPFELQDDSEVIAYERWLSLEREVVRTWLEPIGEQFGWAEGEREVRLWINNLDTIEPECSARLDIHYICGKNILSIDGKTGAGNYSGKAQTNWQCKVTAVALVNEYDAESVTVSLVKPEAFPNGYHDTYTFDQKELVEVEKQVRYHLAEARKPDAPRHAGSHCNFCPCRAHCPEAASLALLPTVVAQASRGMEKADIEAKVAMLGLPDLVYLWQRQSIVKNVLEAVSARLRGTSEAVLGEYGIRLAPGKDTSYVAGKDIKALCEALVGSGLPEDAVWQCLSLDTAALNDLLHKERGGTKKAAIELAKSLVAPFKTEDRGEKRLVEL